MHDARYAFGLLDDLAADLDDLPVAFALIAQVLRQAGDAGDRVADLVRHTGGQAADAGQALGVHQAVFELLGFGQVLDQQHQAAVAWCQRLGDRRLVQIEAAAMTVVC